MRLYTANIRGISAGIRVQPDDKLGQVVFLGCEGRGRRYEVVA